MIYLYSVIGVVALLPFTVMATGALCSLARRGKGGVTWRLNIALALDRLCAASFGWPDKRTISGWVGQKSQTSTNNIWDIYVWIVDTLFYQGHCIDAANNEGWNQG